MIFDVWNLRRVSSEEEHGAVNSGVEISKFSSASKRSVHLGAKDTRFSILSHGFESRTEYLFWDGLYGMTAGSVKA
jgi:hypothetical protein